MFNWLKKYVHRLFCDLQVKQKSSLRTLFFHWTNFHSDTKIFETDINKTINFVFTFILQVKYKPSPYLRVSCSRISIVRINNIWVILLFINNKLLFLGYVDFSPVFQNNRDVIWIILFWIREENFVGANNNVFNPEFCPLCFDVVYQADFILIFPSNVRLLCQISVRFLRGKISCNEQEWYQFQAWDLMLLILFQKCIVDDSMCTFFQ